MFEILENPVIPYTLKDFEDEPGEMKIPVSRSIVDLIQDETLVKPPVLVEGLLYSGEMLLLGGGSKSYKSWSLIDLGLAVATGSSWWGMPCKRGRVLFVDFELNPYFWRERLLAVACARKLEIDQDIRFLSCRGFSPDAVRAALEREAETHPFDMMLVDPLYSFLQGRDENSAGDIGTVMEELRALSKRTGCALVVSHHFSKGNQSGKNSLDRFSGSGVFARYPDSLLTMTPHQEEGAFTVEPILRNFPNKEPFVVRWQFPLMIEDKTLDPSDLKKVGGRPEEVSEKDLLDLVSKPLSHKEWLKAAEAIGFSKATFNRKVKTLSQNERVTQSPGTKLYVKKLVS